MEKLIEKYKRAVLINEAMGEKGKLYKTEEEVQERHDDIIKFYNDREEKIVKFLVGKISTYSFRNFDTFEEWRKKNLDNYELSDAKKFGLQEEVTKELEKQFNEEKEENNNE